MSKLLKRYDLILTVVLFLLVIPAEELGWFGGVEDALRGYWQVLRWSRANPLETSFRGDDVVMVTTDDAFYEAYGAYPMRRVDYGVLTRNLGQLGAKVVVIDQAMDQPSTSGEDDATARMYAQTRNVVLISTLDTDFTGRTALDITYPVAALRRSIRSGYAERSERPGALRVRVFPEMIDRDDGWPIAVQAVALYRDVTPRLEDGVLELGELDVLLDHGTDVYVDFPKVAENHRFLSDTYAIPAMQILKLQQLPADDVVRLTFEIRDKIVLVGDISQIAEDAFGLPVGRAYGVEFIAAGIHTFLNGAPLRAAPWWVEGLVSLSFLALLLATAWLRRHLLRMLVSVAVLVAYVIAVALAHAELGVVLALTGNVLAGVVGALLISLRLYRGTSTPADGDRAFQTVRSAALAFHGQGKLDQAFEKLQEMPLDETIADLIYNLGLDYERKRLFPRAAGVYQYLADWDPDFSDVASRLAKAERVATDPLQAARSLGATMAPPGSSLPVSTLGRYQIVEQLGETTMGVIYRGLDPETKRTVEIKTMSLSRTFGSDALDEGRARFLHEARSAGQLDHPHIVAIYDAGQEEDLAFIAMEHLDGHDLTPYTLKGQLLPMDAVLDVLAQCAEALDYAHAKGVLHRHIEPSNVIYDPKSGTAKITDFAIAHVADAGVRSSVRGKPSYMSPEDAMGIDTDGRSDLFSLGAVLYQLCCGELPFQGDSMATLRYKIVNEPPPDIVEIDPRVPATVRKVLENALRKEPRRRYPSGAKFAEHLRLCKQRLQAARKSA